MKEEEQQEEEHEKEEDTTRSYQSAGMPSFKGQNFRHENWPI